MKKNGVFATAPIQRKYMTSDDAGQNCRRSKHPTVVFLLEMYTGVACKDSPTSNSGWGSQTWLTTNRHRALPNSSISEEEEINGSPLLSAIHPRRPNKEDMRNRKQVAKDPLVLGQKKVVTKDSTKNATDGATQPTEKANCRSSVVRWRILQASPTLYWSESIESVYLMPTARQMPISIWRSSWRTPHMLDQPFPMQLLLPSICSQIGWGNMKCS